MRVELDELGGGGQGLSYPGSRLTLEAEFGDNPGALRMFRYVPPGAGPGAPLMVVLHGCTQTARGYDQGTGWSALAERFGFALLMPEQSRRNNPNGCLNWFQPEDTRRGDGEGESVRNMTAWMIDTYALDPARVFICGLSAGGAMTSAMLAAYPELFAGGAIIAGLPAGAARNLPEALAAMHRVWPRPAGGWGQAVRAASPHKGPWPRISVWHGDADSTVAFGNMDAIVTQWREVQGLDGAAEEDREGRATHRVWRDKRGTAVIESYAIAGLGHGTPIKPGNADDACGEPMPFILDAGISSSYRIAQFFGLDRKAARTAPKPAARKVPREVAVAREAVILAEPPAAVPESAEAMEAGRLRRIIALVRQSLGLGE